MVFTTFSFGEDRRNTSSVFSFPLQGFDAESGFPSTMYSHTGPPSSGSGNSRAGYRPSYSFGPTLFTYIADDDLHARLYDGSVDLVLEHGVSYLYGAYLYGTYLYGMSPRYQGNYGLR